MLAGVRAPMSFHVARHSFADIAQQRGGGVHKIRKALGHSNLKVPQTYLAAFDDGAAEIADNLEAALDLCRAVADELAPGIR